MDPLTLLGLVIGGAVLFGRRGSVAPVVPAGSSTAFTPPTPGSSPIVYEGALPPVRGIAHEDVSASPIEQSGYIPPYVADAGSSAVALSLDWGRQNPGATATMDGLGCPCGSCGLGDARSDLRALDLQLRALRAGFRAQIRAAAAARQWGSVASLVDDLAIRQRELVEAYQAQHPGAYPPRLAKSVAPTFQWRGR